MSEITVTVNGGDGSSSVTASVGDTINVTTSPLAGPLPELQIAAGTGITVDSKDGVSTISANLSELSIPANLADLTDVSAGAATTGQALVWGGSEWSPGNIPPGTTVNGLPGAVNLVSGDNVAITVDGQNITIASVGGGGGVAALNGLTGALTLAAGDGVTIASSGSTITLNATADLTGYATESYIDSAVASLVNGSPAALDTLAELANALSNDSNFAATVTASLAAKADINHDHVKANITDLTTGDLDMQGNRVLFANYYATQADFPDPAVYHGMVAHSHADGAFYGAHADAWVRLANQSEIPAATSVNTLTGDITLVAGDNINVTSSGQNITITGQQAGVVWQTPPQSGSSPGNAGDIAYDDNFLYLRTSQAWRQVALSPISTSITISQQPSNQSVSDGDTATFAVLATAGDETITYQWEQSSDNGSTFADIGGATSNSLTVTANLSLDGYQYRAALSAPGAADVTTSAATLTVAETFDILAENGDRLMTEGGDSLDHDGFVATLSFTQHPTDQTLDTAGGSVTFSAVAKHTGGLAASYQWYKDGVEISGETASTLTITPNSGDSGSSYWCVASAGGLAATSNAATLTVRTLVATFSELDETYSVYAEGGLQFSNSATSIEISPPTLSAYESSEGAIYYPFSVGYAVIRVLHEGYSYSSSFSYPQEQGLITYSGGIFLFFDGSSNEGSDNLPTGTYEVQARLVINPGNGNPSQESQVFLSTGEFEI